MSLRRIFLSSAAALAFYSAPALAAPTIIGSGATVPVGQEQSQAAGTTTQIRLDDGSIISFVGAARYTIAADGSLNIISGNVTVLSGANPVRITSGSTQVTVTGGSAMNVSAGMITSHVLSGITEIGTGSSTQSFSAGEAWEADNGSISQVFAAGPQAVTPVANLQVGVSAAALNGFPVVLGEALAALGASSDIVNAAQNFDAVQQGAASVFFQALPGDLNALVNFQAELLAALGELGGFEGSSPAIVDTYLRFLAEGGQIAEFQSAYLSLVSTYLELLRTGELAGDFTGLGALDIQAYLDFLNSIGGLSQLGSDQQAIVAEYLEFIRNGGLPNAFIFSDVELDASVVALYQNSLNEFVSFIRAGGLPSDFATLDQETLARYIQLLSNAGELNVLFGAQAEVLQAYAEFLAAGGIPNNFDQLDGFGLTEELIAEYNANLQLFLQSLFDGNPISTFAVDADELARQIAQLEQEGVLGDLFAAQRAVLLEFAAFLEAGNTADAFEGFFALGFSDAVVQAYANSINTLLMLVADGGDLVDFPGGLQTILTFVSRLQASGQLGDAFTEAQQAALLNFVNFVEAGNSAEDFTGFVSLGLSDAVIQAYVAAIETFLQFIIDGGEIADFSGDLSVLFGQIADLQLAGVLSTSFSEDVFASLTAFLAFLAEGNLPTDFTGFSDLSNSNGGGSTGGTVTPVAGETRENQFVAYATNTNGFDGRDPATVVYDETTGAPISYIWTASEFTRENERPSVGTAQLAEAGRAGDIMGWARWTNGRSGGRYFSQLDGIDLPSNAGWHIISGTPATNLPTSGTVSYDLIGNTNPTVRNGTVEPGTLDSAHAAVAFGTTPRVGIELNMTVGGEGYMVTTIGGVSDLSQGLTLTEGNVSFGGNAFQGTVTGSGGSACSGDISGCNASIVGWLAGEAATHMGIAYTLGNTGFDNQIDGVAAFAQAGAAASASSGAASVTDKAITSSDWARWDGASSLAVTDVDIPAVTDLARLNRENLTSIIPDWISFEKG